MNKDKEIVKEELTNAFDKLDYILEQIQGFSSNSRKIINSKDYYKTINELNLDKKSANENLTEIEYEEVSFDKEEQSSVEKKKTNLQIADNMVSNMNTIFGSLSNIANQYAESKRLDVEIQKLKNQLVSIFYNHQQEMTIIQNVFSERHMIFQKLFTIVDYGMDNNNDKLLIATMQMINNLAMKNPLEMLEHKRGSNNKIHLDNEEPLQLNF